MAKQILTTGRIDKILKVLCSTYSIKELEDVTFSRRYNDTFGISSKQFSLLVKAAAQIKSKRLESSAFTSPTEYIQ